MLTIGQPMGESERPANECLPAQASEQFLRGFLSLDRLVKVLVEMQKMPVSDDAGSAEDLLESLEYVGGLLDDIVESRAMVQVVFRLPVELMDRLDGYVKRLNKADRSRRVTRSDVVRQLLTKALEPKDKPE
ncbi:MAG: hypothetical protein WAN46_01860 [Gammaproteobacteria bacterium]